MARLLHDGAAEETAMIRVSMQTLAVSRRLTLLLAGLAAASGLF